jgi:formate hydrogenlyase subunit 4
MILLLLFLKFLATLIHAGLMFALAPLLLGLVQKWRAWLLGRRGAPVVQPYLDLAKLLRKTPLIPEMATEYFKIWPVLAASAMSVAVFLVPGFCTGLLTAGQSDFIVLAGFLLLARASTLLAGLETGFGFGGAGAARELLFGIFSEAALLVVILGLSLLAQNFTVDGVAVYFGSDHVGLSVSLGFALAAMLAVALTEAGRIPADNPAGHLELGMVHEALLLEYSGKFLLLFHYAAMLRLLVWFCLISTVFLPFGMARATDFFSWPVGVVWWGVKLVLMSLALALFEVSTAKMRVFRVPAFLGTALLLGVLASVFLFVASRIGG